MSGLVERVAETITRYNMFSHGHKVGVAVSGGPDSVCLLYILLELAPRWALHLHVLHLNHKLRGEESDQDAEFVWALATKLGLKVDVEAVDLASQLRQHPENVEQAARQARLAFFREKIESGVVDRVAVGHTLDDQAETVLFRLLRGTGISGLAGILPVAPPGLVRPLLEVRRKEVVEFLLSRGVQWREDSSNLDTRLRRNKIRHELLPALCREWNPSLPEALARLANLAREEEEHWQKELLVLAPKFLRPDGGGCVLRISELSSLDRAATRRLLRHAIEQTRGSLSGFEFQHLDSVLELLARSSGDGSVTLPGIKVTRSFDWVRVAPSEEPPPPSFSFEVNPPCSVVLPGNFGRIELCLVSPASAQPDSLLLDWERLSRPLLLRNWQPGDHYHPAKHRHDLRLKLLFQKHRVPSWLRPRWPVLVAGGEIVWARLFGPAAVYKPRDQGGLALEIIDQACAATEKTQSPTADSGLQ